ncbi:MAG: isochorismatase family protein [Chitinivibrionales bacterium]|nr:isochorismatase family protein [Chitinivibrionales bacterium]
MKHPHILSKDNTGLLVVDVQEKFAPAIPGFDEMVHNIVKLILTFQMFKMPVLVTEQYPRGLGNTVEKIRRQFTFLEVIEKLELACTDNTHFWTQLNPLELETIVVCGIETHVCVNQTVLGLIDKGFTVHCVADAAGSRNSLDHEIGIQKMAGAGALISTTEISLFELAQKAGTQSFKYIQKMVKSRIKKETSEHSSGSDSEDIADLVQQAESALGEDAPSAQTAPGNKQETATENDKIPDDSMLSQNEDSALEREEPGSGTGESSENEHADTGPDEIISSDDTEKETENTGPGDLPDTGAGEKPVEEDTSAEEETVDTVPETDISETDREIPEDSAGTPQEQSDEQIPESPASDESGNDTSDLSESDIDDLLGNEDENKNS